MVPLKPKMGPKLNTRTQNRSNMEATQPKMEPCKSQNIPKRIQHGTQHYFFSRPKWHDFWTRKLLLLNFQSATGKYATETQKGVQNVYVEPNMDSNTSPATQNGALETLKLFLDVKYKTIWMKWVPPGNA